MRTRDRIKTVFAAISNDVRDLVVTTHASYCPTIQATTFSEFDHDQVKAAEMADFAAQAFDSMAIIYGQDRRAYNRRNHSRAFTAYCRKAEAQRKGQ